MSHAQAYAVTERALRKALKDIARQMMSLLVELDTKQGVFVRDQGRQLSVLDSQLADLLRNRTAPAVLQALRSQLALILDATLSQHRALGGMRPEISATLGEDMVPSLIEVALSITDGGQDLIIEAVTRTIGAGLAPSEVSGPLADALEITRMRAATAIKRAIRELHEITLRRMGEAQDDEFVYVYVGPPADSPNIRPYCARRTGKALTQRAADALDPRKRFNCRHSLAPLPRYLVEEEGLTLYDRTQ